MLINFIKFKSLKYIANLTDSCVYYYRGIKEYIIPTVHILKLLPQHWPTDIIKAYNIKIPAMCGRGDVATPRVMSLLYRNINIIVVG